MIYPRRDRGHAEVADHYDELDSIYRRLWGEHVHHGLWRTGNETPHEAVNALSDLVGERLSFAPQEHLVYIGCGYGATARRFADRGALVTSADQVQALALVVEQVQRAEVRLRQPSAVPVDLLPVPAAPRTEEARA